jgi:haloalkane dehalogenase
LPLDGEPADVVAIWRYASFMSPRLYPLFINADPGAILVGKQRECRSWPNQTEVTVREFISSGRLTSEIGAALRSLRYAR